MKGGVTIYGAVNAELMLPYHWPSEKLQRLSPSTIVLGMCCTIALERKKAAALPPLSQSGSEREELRRASVSLGSWLMHETTLQHS